MELPKTLYNIVKVSEISVATGLSERNIVETYVKNPAKIDHLTVLAMGSFCVTHNITPKMLWSIKHTVEAVRNGS